MNNWQPINTAPKDRRILIACEDGDVIIGRSGRHGGFIHECDDINLIIVGEVAWMELPKFDGVADKIIFDAKSITIGLVWGFICYIITMLMFNNNSYSLKIMCMASSIYFITIIFQIAFNKMK